MWLLSVSLSLVAAAGGTNGQCKAASQLPRSPAKVNASPAAAKYVTSQTSNCLWDAPAWARGVVDDPTELRNGRQSLGPFIKLPGWFPPHASIM
jgi:hypothetical protein